MKKARAWLDARGVAYAFYDYAASGIDRSQLSRWARQLGWERLCNRAGTTFRRLPASEPRGLTAPQARDLTAARPSMIKRPVLTIADRGTARIPVGCSPE